MYFSPWIEVFSQNCFTINLLLFWHDFFCSVSLFSRDMIQRWTNRIPYPVTLKNNSVLSFLPIRGTLPEILLLIFKPLFQVDFSKEKRVHEYPNRSKTLSFVATRIFPCWSLEAKQTVWGYSALPRVVENLFVNLLFCRTSFVSFQTIRVRTSGS